jgi:chloramphenicol 3-O-phosphotransferase
MPEVLILTGPPAAGKSTVARALADRYDRVAHIEVDTLRHFVTPTGYIAPGKPGFERQQRLAAHNACSLARNFLEERFAVIIDDVVVDNGDVELYLEGLLATEAPVHLVRLLPSLETVLARNQGRSEGRMPAERVEKIWRDFVAAGEIGGATIDSTGLTAHETADKLQALTTSGASLVWAPAMEQIAASRKAER